MDYRQQKIHSLSEEELKREDILKRRILDPDVKRKFRNAYAFKAGWDYSTLNPFCENIIMATEGFADHIDRSRAKLELAMKDYDSDKDVVVVVGRSFDNLLVGTIVAQKVLKKPVAFQSYAIAVYYNFSYRFYQVFLDPMIESYELGNR